MKRILAFILAAMLLLSLAACGGETEEAPKETTKVSAYKSGDGYTELTNPVSWEDINAFPVVHDGMTIDEARKLSVDFFRYCKTAQWIPADNWDFTHHADGSSPDSLQAGVIYGGLPYVGLSYSAIYRLMDYIDPETGVVDIENAGRYQTMFGNQCAQGAYQGWSRVINSAKYSGTPRMTNANGFYALGDYTYDSFDVLPTWSVEYQTKQVCADNGTDVMYESYALLKAGDGIVYFTTAGHVVMIATDAVVVRDANGKIDGNQSYVTVIDQTPTWGTAQNEQGQTYSYEKNVDEKWTFAKLFSGNYLPFVFAEWLGTDPIESAKVEFSHTGDSITEKELFNSKVTCNYHIYDIYAEIYDKWGSEIVKLNTHNNGASEYELKFNRMATETSVIWGNLDSLEAGGDYTVKVYAQLGTGERPTLWEGKLVIE